MTRRRGVDAEKRRCKTVTVKFEAGKLPGSQLSRQQFEPESRFLFWIS
jgi:hypothetical protein